MEQGLIAKRKPWWHRLWWRIRGVGERDHRRICGRCGWTGQMHFDMTTNGLCWRFRPETTHELAQRIRGGDPWQHEHPDYPKSDWRHEVANDDTLLGYWEWVEHQIESYETN